MEKMKIRSYRRFRIVRTRSPYGRRLKFVDKRDNHNELSSSLLDEPFIINKQVEDHLLTNEIITSGKRNSTERKLGGGGI